MRFKPGQHENSPQEHHPDLIEELESDVNESHTQPENDNKHQFDEHGLKYERKYHLILLVGILALAALGIGWYLFYTEEGQRLIGQNTSEFTDNNFNVVPDSYAAGSEAASSISNKFSIPQREFSDSEPVQILEQMEEDISNLSDWQNQITLFPNLDSELELGVEARSAEENE